MSGGALDYEYIRIEEVKDILRNSEEWQKLDNGMRERLIERLNEISLFLHDLEWWLSGDIGIEELKKYHLFDVMRR